MTAFCTTSVTGWSMYFTCALLIGNVGRGAAADTLVGARRPGALGEPEAAADGDESVAWVERLSVLHDQAATTTAASPLPRNTRTSIRPPEDKTIDVTRPGRYGQAATATSTVLDMRERCTPRS